MGEVEGAVAAAASGRLEEWVSNLASRLEDLRTAFRRHVELTESPTGFLAEIVSDAPRLAHAVGQLRVEHEVIGAGIDEALVSVRSAVRADDGSVSEAREKVLDVLRQLVRHRHRGADVVYEAYSVDIEGGD
jgi:hypothetical protein